MEDENKYCKKKNTISVLFVQQKFCNFPFAFLEMREKFILLLSSCVSKLAILACLVVSLNSIISLIFWLAIINAQVEYYCNYGLKLSLIDSVEFSAHNVNFFATGKNNYCRTSVLENIFYIKLIAKTKFSSNMASLSLRSLQ